MKVSKKTAAALCIIVPILALVLFCAFWLNQKPNFSKYHSYAVETESDCIPLTDEQFDQVVQLYKNDETLQIASAERLFGNVYKTGYQIRLYRSDDMTGFYDIMYTGNSGKGDGSTTMCLWINNKCFMFENSKDRKSVV